MNTSIMSRVKRINMSAIIHVCAVFKKTHGSRTKRDKMKESGFKVGIGNVSLGLGRRSKLKLILIFPQTC